MAYGFDIAAVVKAMLGNLLQVETPLILCPDSKFLYDCLMKLGTP